ncbi:50S ribosomal protein L18e [Candidatus Micrarchaeota archaeon]|nr:50S ribosomal protein L18e [Candidatus Micrarchaeota archaeon]
MKTVNLKRLKSRKENLVLLSLIETLAKDDKPVWKKVILELSRPRRSRVEVNLSKLDEYGNDGGTVLVPGKVLGSGSLSKKMTIAAYSFSGTAKKLIADAGGKALSIESLYKANPTGRDVLILK